MPRQINITDFEERLYLKIAEVNANPSKLRYIAPKIYGKKERRSDYQRIFKTMGDCSSEHYEKTLVLPTILMFQSPNQQLGTAELQIKHNDKVSHNNISHTQRLGLIVKKDKTYGLTPLGDQYWHKKVDFKTLFKKQMLRYSETTEENGEVRLLFPYRTCLKVLLKVKTINFMQFAFAIYTLYDSSDKSVQEAIEGVKYLRVNYPKLYLTSEANKQHVLAELNKHFATVFKEADIWSKKTTINNQFIYCRENISLFDEFVEVDSHKAAIKKGCEHKGYHYLADDNQLEFERNPDKRFVKYISSFVTVIIFGLFH